MKNYLKSVKRGLKICPSVFKLPFPQDTTSNNTATQCNAYPIDMSTVYFCRIMITFLS